MLGWQGAVRRADMPVEHCPKLGEGDTGSLGASQINCSACSLLWGKGGGWGGGGV